MVFDERQYHILEIGERIAAGMSTSGALFVILTFTFNSRFHKPINRLVFYASFGNVLANIAHFLGPRIPAHFGINHPLCQLQAVMLQWFMAADGLWTFAMALNVYLSFFYSFDQARIRSLEWVYLPLCYGMPAIPAITYIFVHTEKDGRVYGDAILWCWVSVKWNPLRVATFYGPMWLVIILTTAIYVRVGSLILKWRRRNVQLSRGTSGGHHYSKSQGLSTSSTITATYEVTITTEPTTPKILAGQDHNVSPGTSSNGGEEEDLTKVPTITVSPSKYSADMGFHERHYKSQRKSNASVKVNRATLRYFKCALLFFVALLCTWVPASIHRISMLMHPDRIVFGIGFPAALSLPLQGFWNFIVYTATSKDACKGLFKDCTDWFVDWRHSRKCSRKTKNRGVSTTGMLAEVSDPKCIGRPCFSPPSAAAVPMHNRQRDSVVGDWYGRSTVDV